MIEEKDKKCKCCGRVFLANKYYQDYCPECCYKWEYEIP